MALSSVHLTGSLRSVASSISNSNVPSYRFEDASEESPSACPLTNIPMLLHQEREQVLLEETEDAMIQHDTGPGDYIEAIEEESTVSLLQPSSQHSQGLSQLLSRTKFQSCYIVVMLVVSVFVVLLSFWLGVQVEYHSRNHDGNHSRIEPGQRARNVKACISYLSGDDQDTSSSLQAKAVDWFVNGPGRDFVGIPSRTQECHSDKEFAQLVGLVALWYGLLLEESTESHKMPASVSTLQDVCHSWHRVVCSDNTQEHDTRVLKLHLSDLDSTITKGASIPSEIGLLPYLIQAEFYGNDFLEGTLPECISNLTNLEILHVHLTSVTGTVPASFENLIQLRELFVDRTKMHGTMPESLCVLPNIEQVHSDCKGPEPQMSCACCTHCY